MRKRCRTLAHRKGRGAKGARPGPKRKVVTSEVVTAEVVTADAVLSWAASRPGPFTLAEALAATGQTPARACEMRVTTSLKAAGFEPFRTRVDGVQQRAYRRPEVVTGFGAEVVTGGEPGDGAGFVGSPPEVRAAVPEVVTEVVTEAGDTPPPDDGPDEFDL